VGGGGPTLPGVAAGGPDVDVRVGHPPGDAHVAHALQGHVVVGVAQLVAVRLPLVVGVEGQVVAPHVALAHHAPLLPPAALDDLHVAMAARLGSHGDSGGGGGSTSYVTFVTQKNTEDTQISASSSSVLTSTCPSARSRWLATVTPSHMPSTISDGFAVVTG